MSATGTLLDECIHTNSDVFCGLSEQTIVMERVCMDCTHTIEHKKVNRAEDARDPFMILDEFRRKVSRNDTAG